MRSISTPDLLASLGMLVKSIPPGKVTTYGRLAEALGDTRAAIWIASTLQQAPADWPAHRVVRLDGQIAGSSHPDQLALNRSRLKDEGIPSNENGQVLKPVFFQPPPLSLPPLAQLKAEQQHLSQQVSLAPLTQLPLTVAGIDIAFPSENQALVAYVAFDVSTCQQIAAHKLLVEVQFPYISGYLAYREIPAYLELFHHIEQQEPLAELLMVDGSGVLHPRGLGVASHLGLLLNKPTIGISKRLLCGKLGPEESALDQPIEWQHQQIGCAMKNHAESKPVFVSPGTGCSPQNARDLVRQFWKDHRLPEPTFAADQLSKSRS